MFSLLKPDNQTITEFLAKQVDVDFSYNEVGASRFQSPAGYNLDHNRMLLGNGESIYAKAIEAVKNWRMFDFPWIKIYPSNAPIESGQNLAVLINHFGFWSLNATRIVYVLEEKEEIERYGFAYGTLNDHGECGEERFSVEYDRQTGEVWYDIFAFSKPSHLLAMMGYPLGRYLQNQFALESKRAMQKAVE